MDCNTDDYYMEGYETDDWCTNITTFRSLCQIEAPQAACFAERLDQQNCTSSVSRGYEFSYVGTVCSPTGLDLMSRAISSECMSMWWWLQREVIAKWTRCFNLYTHERLRESCSAREIYAQCHHNVTEEACGADFARVAKMHMKAAMDTFNRQPGALQCDPL